MVSSVYLRLLIFLLEILIPASWSPAFHMIYSVYKLNKQGDNMQLWCTSFPIWNLSVGPCLVLTVASWPAYRFLRRQVRWSGVPISLRIFQFVVIHTVKDFGIVSKAAAAASKSLQSCPTLRPHRRQPTRLPCPWDSAGKNTGVGCHFLLQSMKVKSQSEVTQSCLTLRDPMDCSLPGSSVHGIFQARPYGLQPTRLLCPWDFPGKSTGVGCHCLLPIKQK